jgi:hypothetical protein
MSPGTAKQYYHKYFKQQNPDIPTPSHIAAPKCYTQEQINEVIHYIVNDKMSIRAASKKTNFCSVSARKYYRQYLNYNNNEPPVPRTTKHYTQDEINNVIGYFVDDKMSIKAASKKAKMHYLTAHKYIHRYFNSQKA